MKYTFCSLMVLLVAASGCSKNSEDGQESPVNKIQGQTALPEAWQDATGLLSPHDRNSFAKVNKNMGFELTARSYVKTVLNGYNIPVQKITQEELQIKTTSGKVIATSKFERIPLISCDWRPSEFLSPDWLEGLFVNGQLIGIAQNDNPRPGYTAEPIIGRLCQDSLNGMKLCKGHPNKGPVKFVSCTVKKGTDNEVIHFSE
jgi:hypothetical protein